MGRHMRIALLLVVCAGLVAVEASAAAGERRFEGTTTCVAMKVEVSFAYDAAASQIRDFYAEHRCLKGGHAIAVIGAKIDVRGDGTFSFKDENGTSVQGRIEGGQARGEFSNLNCSLRCSDEAFHEPCQQWTAKQQ